MPTRLMRRSASCAIAAVAGLAFTLPAFSDIYDPPPAYYAGVSGTGATLKSTLRTAISAGFISRSYGDARYALPIIDRDPNNAANVVLVYNGVSVSGAWDLGATWNREHTWPQSFGNSSTSAPQYSDLHMLRPCSPSLNSSRGNKAYGPDPLWDANRPGTPIDYHGEAARAIFYAATRYGDPAGSTTTGNFVLINGQPLTGESKMGDLASLLKWHYESPVTERDRKRNQTVYSQSLNPTYYQNNRNPFVDHPEYVWAIWGTQANTSTIYVGAAAAGDGSSSVSINFGTVIVGAVLSNQNVTVSKTGYTPTTFDITASGAATSSAALARQAFPYNAQSRVISVGVSGAVAPGSYSGSLTVNNTDLTSAAAGQGAADADDVVTVTATVLAHSNGSFSGSTNQDTLTIDLGKFRGGTGLHSQSFDVFNLASVPGFTASLDLDSVTPSGDSAVLGTDLSAPAQIAAGSSVPALVWLDTTQPVGTYQAVYSVSVSDQGLPGETPGSTLVLTVQGEVVCPADFNVDNFVTGDDFDGFVEAFELGDSAADFNNDTFVTGDDFDAFVDAFQLGC